MTDPTTDLPATEWLVQSLRLTCFPDPSQFPSEQNWWREIFGMAADQRTVKPRESLIAEEGEYQGKRLALVVQPLRVNWELTPREELDESVDIPLLGPLSKVLPDLRTIAQKWFSLASCPPLRRIAFGARLVERVQDLHTAYNRLAHYLPCVDLDPDDAADFLFQINRPRPSVTGSPDLRINRLATWSAVRWQLTFVQSVSGTSVGGQALLGYGVQLLLDINTDAALSDNLPADRLLPLFDELQGLGEEIARHGDVGRTVRN
jgi:hypothetical protein